MSLGLALSLILISSNYPYLKHIFTNQRGWSGDAMVLGKIPVPGRPTIWMIVGQGPIALALGAVGGCLDILLSSVLSLLFLLSLGDGLI